MATPSINTKLTKRSPTFFCNDFNSIISPYFSRSIAERTPKLNREMNTDTTRFVAFLIPRASNKNVKIIKIVMGKKSLSFSPEKAALIAGFYMSFLKL